MGDYKIVSADDHMDLSYIPPKLWEERLEARFRDRAPKVEETPDGKVWRVDGEIIGNSGKTLGALVSAIGRAGIEDNGFRPSTPELRLADMDTDGIHAQVIYGAPSGLKIKDPELKDACYRAYNDWGVEFNASAPDRLCLLAYLPLASPEAAVAELNRVVKMGHRGAIFGIYETHIPVHDECWESLWSVAEEAGIPISFHLGGGTSYLRNIQRTWEFAAFVSVVPMQMDEYLASMVFSGALERHPGLKLVLGESGIGWVPYVIERMDLEWVNHTPNAQDYKITTRPSEVFSRQVFATYEEDRIGVMLIPEVGVDNVMWASDYPHPDSTFPNSMQAIEEQFAAMDPAIKRKVTSETAARLYGFDGVL
jgi:predicted TIM-barrel fold metal-dependent hydrolase